MNCSHRRDLPYLQLFSSCTVAPSPLALLCVTKYKQIIANIPTIQSSFEICLFVEDPLHLHTNRVNCRLTLKMHNFVSLIYCRLNMFKVYKLSPICYLHSLKCWSTVWGYCYELTQNWPQNKLDCVKGWSIKSSHSLLHLDYWCIKFTCI